MQTEEFDFISVGETKIRGKIWLPDEEPQAILCIVHGLGEHCGRYDHFAKYFTDERVIVYAMDLRGHGLSEGKKGHASIGDLMEDAQELIITARRDHNDLPIFLFGHSMGGNILANYVIKFINSEISGAIFSSPWLKLENPPKSIKERTGSFFKNVFPSITQSNRLKVEDLTHNEKEQQKYLNDPLVHDRISLRLYFDLKKSGKTALEKANLIDMPALVCHGNQDNITAKDASKIFSSNIENADFHLWEGEKHEPHNDFNREKIISYYVNWMKNELRK